LLARDEARRIAINIAKLLKRPQYQQLGTNQKRTTLASVARAYCHGARTPVERKPCWGLLPVEWQRPQLNRSPEAISFANPQDGS
jgi:hypothetical protein